jgi:UDP-2-acetamido-2,6-beta-L-arabino-hexul-4-ose reductase
MKVMVTGAGGFIGSNLIVRLKQLPSIEIVPIGRRSSESDLRRATGAVDFIFHLAGVNRPDDPAEFVLGNAVFTSSLCAAVSASERKTPIVYASSRRASENTDYGRSKGAAEAALLEFAKCHGSAVRIFRLPNVFGKWCRPNYNSAVATFCHNIANGLPIQIEDPNISIELAYIDDVLNAFLNAMRTQLATADFLEVAPVYSTTIGGLADQIRAFHDGRRKLAVEHVGTGFKHKLYATYLSHLPSEQFTYPLKKEEDHRGFFAEILKTVDSGQFSVLAVLPGMTRGDHYHHTKAEKFIIVEGEALFRFRNIVTGKTHELHACGATPTVVETIPGWSHNITNVGSKTMIALLWASEVFDPQQPDTIAQKV